MTLKNLSKVIILQNNLLSTLTPGLVLAFDLHLWQPIKSKYKFWERGWLTLEKLSIQSSVLFKKVNNKHKDTKNQFQTKLFKTVSTSAFVDSEF